ncbi:hypothetical protein [Nitrosomonas aestuarii]|uniref:hypothetical protein n=1 Tax=Nitrosomonas aestuarii TaxID=52441 RepID=UPI000D2FF65A|nr:hypothetical protein [Nitrosomonas aestuarii]PTN12806.1 hypothetical protein C8R11_10281 [Nitrosomonas aestuarii]
MRTIIFLLVVTITSAGCVSMDHNQKKHDMRTANDSSGESNTNLSSEVPRLPPGIEKELIELTNIENIGFLIAVDRNGHPLVIAANETKSAEIFSTDARRPARFYSELKAIPIVKIEKSHCYSLGLHSRYYAFGGVTVEICSAF